MSRGLVVAIGSGELGPSLTATHRWVLERVGGRSITVLDSSYGFQVNAPDLTDKISSHFASALGVDVEVASLPRPRMPSLERERMVAAVRRSRFVFAGPGSPSYALRVWREAGLGSALEEVVENGGAVVMASAAALTLGVKTVPVYEIYKVGEKPFWLDGLDLLGMLGLRMVVVPHWNNAEGGSYDTSHCFVGADRFATMVGELPLEVGVLGVDEHTAAVIDLEAETISVTGVGGAYLNDAPVASPHPLQVPPRRYRPPPPPEPPPPSAERMLNESLIAHLLELRKRARLDGRYHEADAIRERLVGLGIGIQDTRRGTTFELPS
ncbi:MAG: hypothetical protein ACT4OP_08420 [Actinomycetota bacterium]